MYSFFRVSFIIIFYCRLFTVRLRTSLRENVLYNFLHLQFPLEVDQLHSPQNALVSSYLSIISYILHSLLVFLQNKQTKPKQKQKQKNQNQPKKTKKNPNIFVLNENQKVHCHLRMRWHRIRCSNSAPLSSLKSDSQWQLCNADAAQNGLCEVWCA